MNPCSKRVMTVSGNYLIRRAERLARNLPGEYQTKREVIDGYLVEGRRAGDLLTATVMDLPGRIISFGGNVSGQSSLAMQYSGPIRDRFAPRDQLGMQQAGEQAAVFPVGLIRFIGAPLTGQNVVAPGRAHEFEGGVVLPFIVSASPVQRNAIGPTWAGIPESNTLWLVFQTVFAGSKTLPDRTVSIDDATIRSLAPGYDLVRRDADTTYSLLRASSPFAECFMHEDSLYFAVPVQRPGDGDGRCLGAVLVMRVDFDDSNGTALVGMSQLIEPDDFGEPLFGLDPFTTEKGGANIDRLAIAVEPGPKVTVAGRLRNTLHTPPGVSPSKRWVLSAKVKIEIEAGPPALSYAFVDTLAGAAATLPAGAVSDPAEVVMCESVILLPTDTGVLDVTFLVIGTRTAGGETDAAAVVSAEALRYVTTLSGAEAIQSAGDAGWSGGYQRPGTAYYSNWLSGTLSSVYKNSSTLAQGKLLISGTLAFSDTPAFAVASGAGLELHPFSPTGASGMRGTVYQREVLDGDGQVVMPWAAYVTMLDGDTPAAVVLSGATEVNPIPVSVPVIASGGAYYLGNPFASYGLGYGRLYG